MAGDSRRPLVGVVGSCNVDMVVRCHDLPRPGETVLGGDAVRLPGGKGANQAVAAARLGASVTLVAAVGRDEVGEWMREQLAGFGLDLSSLQRSHRATGTAFITVDDRGENQIVVAPGANRDLNLDGVDLSHFDVVVTQLEIDPSLTHDIVERSSRVLLNVAPARVLDDDVVQRCAVVIANEVESELLPMAKLEHVVVTLGERGAVQYRYGREVSVARARPVDPVDTVGAGDVFCAAYATQMARGASDDEALQFAVAAGSLATMAEGAQGALPTEEEVRRWLGQE